MGRAVHTELDLPNSTKADQTARCLGYITHLATAGLIKMMVKINYQASVIVNSKTRPTGARDARVARAKTKTVSHSNEHMFGKMFFLVSSLADC